MNTIKKLSLFIALLSMTLAPRAHGMEATATNPDDQLYQAIVNKNVKEAERALAAGANANSERKFLAQAAQMGTAKICELLIAYGADVNQIDPYGQSALSLAALYGHVEACKVLLDHGADVNAQDKWEKTALLQALTNSSEALMQRKIKITELLLEHGAKITILNKNQITPLQYAFSPNQDDTPKLLITRSLFNPNLTERQFQYFIAARNRLYAALMVFKRLCPIMPKDMRKYILRSIPELQQDLASCSQFSPLKIEKIRDWHDCEKIPLRILRMLIQSGQLDMERTVDRIAAHHYATLESAMNMIRKNTNPYRLQKEDNFWYPIERTYGAEIRENIRRHLTHKSITICTVQ